MRASRHRDRPHVRLISPITVDLRSQSYLRELEDQFGVRLSMACVTTGPAAIESEVDHLMAGPDTVRLAQAAEAEGCDAVIIDCMLDPALAACREAVAVPVLGPCETGMHLAAITGHRFSLLAALQRQEGTYRDLARRYGVAERLASVRALGIPILELDRDAGRLQTAMIRAGRAAVHRDGADTLVLGCTAIEGGAARLAALLAADGRGAVVIEALPPTIGLAATMVRCGIAHAREAYPAAPARQPLPVAAPGSGIAAAAAGLT